MKKKGFVGDYVIYLIMLLILALSILAIYFVVNTFNTAWQSTPNLPKESTDIMTNYNNSFIDTWDFFYLFLVIGYVLVTVILAFALRSHPALAMFTILFMIILGIVAVYFSNVYFDVASSSPFSEFAEDFTFMNYFAQKLPHIVVIFGIVFIIILYAKTRSSGTTL